MGSEEFSPFFSLAFSFFFVFPRFASLFFVFLRFSGILLRGRGKRLQFTATMGNFTPTPSAPTPCKTSRVKTFVSNVGNCREHYGNSREHSRWDSVDDSTQRHVELGVSKGFFFGEEGKSQ